MRAAAVATAATPGRSSIRLETSSPPPPRTFYCTTVSDTGYRTRPELCGTTITTGRTVRRRKANATDTISGRKRCVSDRRGTYMSVDTATFRSACRCRDRCTTLRPSSVVAPRPTHTMSAAVNLVVLCLLAAAVTAVRHPVVLVPGDGGSQIEAKLDKPSVVHYLCDKKTNEYDNIWLNLELLVPYVIDCLIDNMRLIYDDVTRTTRSPPGVDIRIPGWGNSSVVEYIDPSLSAFGTYFKSVADTLVGAGLERDVSIRGAPYDFRKAPNENKEFFVKLKALAEETYRQNDDTPIVFVVHSMGGCMTLKFLRDQTQSWKDKYVRALVSLAGAWGGAVKALKVFAVGDDLGVYVLSGSVLKAEQITSPSLSWLLPSPYFWTSDEVLVETDTKNFTVANYKEFFEGINYTTGYEMYLDVKQFMDFGPPGVEVHCLHGSTIPTVEKMIFKAGKFPLKYPKLEYGNGDGTVNSRSLEGCVRWADMQKQKVVHQVFPNADHMTILRDERVMDYIAQLMEKL